MNGIDEFDFDDDDDDLSPEDHLALAEAAEQLAAAMKAAGVRNLGDLFKLRAAQSAQASEPNE